MIQRFALLTAMAVLLIATSACGQTSDRVLAVVNGTEITATDLSVFLISRQIPEAEKADIEHKLVEILIDRQLMRDFLTSRNAQASQTELNDQLSRIRQVIESSGDDPEKVFAKFGLTEAALRKELELPLMWKSYLRLAVSNDRLRQYYQKHREQFDGTQLRVRQIFLKVSKDAGKETINAKTRQLKQLKSRIEKGEIAFTNAAQKHSEAPSKKDGGDAGWITYRGKLPSAVSEAAFALKTGKISDPIRSPFGLHLVTVTERKPGDISLEDVRSIVFNRLSQELWAEMVKDQREKAKIEIRDADREFSKDRRENQ